MSKLKNTTQINKIIDVHSLDSSYIIQYLYINV